MVDLSQPTIPRSIGSWLAPSGIYSVSEYGGAVLVGTEDDGLFLINIEDPTNPSAVERWYEPGLKCCSVAHE